MAGALDKLPAGSSGAPVLQPQAGLPPGGIIGYPGLEPPAMPGMPLGARPAAATARVPLPDERPAHLCTRCKHFFEVEVMQFDDDSVPYIHPMTGQPMKERQGSCLVRMAGGDESSDVAGETIMTCTHFENRRGVVGRIAELVRKVIA